MIMNMKWQESWERTLRFNILQNKNETKIVDQ